MPLEGGEASVPYTRATAVCIHRHGIMARVVFAERHMPSGRRAVQTLSRRKGAEAAVSRRERSFRHRTDDRTDARQISDDPVAERRARDSGGRPRIRRQRARKFSREVRVSSAPDAAVVQRLMMQN